MADARPLIHILAGPNGAGKSTLYETYVRRLTDAELVNADLLAAGVLAHPALTLEEGALGQRLAEARRAELLAARRSFVTESTFSHPSKVELVRAARRAGYRVVIYHVSLDSPDLAVARVAFREGEGGHPVPEDRIRGRYARNPALIREAVRLADWAFVFDNSQLGVPPRRLITFRAGAATDVAANLPRWASELYVEDLPAA
ncbi:MAG TPA: AAA family ATPase [Caulobacteraceae bacterium]|nr:AAA family ATPase [Caulobacteraceae bacterium]